MRSALPAALLVLLTGCGRDEQQCQQDTKVALQAWQDLADYYSRMAAAEDRKVQDAQAELAVLTAEREKHQRASSTWKYRQSSGLQSMRSGEVVRDPTVAQEHGKLAAREGRRTEAATDDEELAIAASMDAEARRAALLQKAELAEDIREALSTHSAEFEDLLAHSEELAGTELLTIALASTATQKATCD